MKKGDTRECPRCGEMQIVELISGKPMWIHDYTGYARCVIDDRLVFD